MRICNKFKNNFEPAGRQYICQSCRFSYDSMEHFDGVNRTRHGVNHAL